MGGPPKAQTARAATGGAKPAPKVGGGASASAWSEPSLPPVDELAALAVSENVPPSEIASQLADKMWSARLAGMQVTMRDRLANPYLPRDL